MFLNRVSVSAASFASVICLSIAPVFAGTITQKYGAECYTRTATTKVTENYQGNTRTVETDRSEYTDATGKAHVQETTSVATQATQGVVNALVVENAVGHSTTISIQHEGL